MCKIRFVIPLLVLLLACGSGVSRMHAADNPGGGFEILKSLVGEWDGKSQDGKKTHLSYRLVSGGTTVMEEFSVEGDPKMNMVTMYHPDGAQLLMTHYCMANNQPRMAGKITSKEPTTITFSFVSGTNMKSANDGHMHHAVFQIPDKNSMTQEWTFQKDGKNTMQEVAQYKRSK